MPDALRSATDDGIRKTIATLLDQRDASATICPSEVARLLRPDDWRPLMPRVREQALAMAARGKLAIQQRGRVIAPGQPLKGPIRLARAAAPHDAPLSTPDGRYLVVKGRLWRKTNPHLIAEVRATWVAVLMDARRALRGKRPPEERQAARAQVDRAKRALGERGPVWWTDGAPDFNRHLVKNTPYRSWHEALPEVCC